MNNNRVNMHTQTPAQAAAKLIREYGDEAYWKAEQRMLRTTTETGFEFYEAVLQKIEQLKS